MRQVNGLALVGMSVKASGGLNQLAKCLAEMRQRDQLILVENLTASSVADKPENLNVSMVLTTTARLDETK